MRQTGKDDEMVEFRQATSINTGLYLGEQTDTTLVRTVDLIITLTSDLWLRDRYSWRKV